MDDMEKALGALKTRVEEFRTANDTAVKDKADKGWVSGELQAKVDILNKAISEAQDTYTTRLDEFETRMNRLDILESAGGADELKKLTAEAAMFSQWTKSNVDVKKYQAYQGAMEQYLRFGDAAGSDVMALMNVGSDPQGGYWVTPDQSGKLVKLIYES